MRPATRSFDHRFFQGGSPGALVPVPTAVANVGLVLSADTSGRRISAAPSGCAVRPLPAGAVATGRALAAVAADQVASATALHAELMDTARMLCSQAHEPSPQTPAQGLGLR